MRLWARARMGALSSSPAALLSSSLMSPKECHLHMTRKSSAHLHQHQKQGVKLRAPQCSPFATLQICAPRALISTNGKAKHGPSKQ